MLSRIGHSFSWATRRLPACEGVVVALECGDGGVAEALGLHLRVKFCRGKAARVNRLRRNKPSHSTLLDRIRLFALVIKARKICSDAAFE